MMRISPAVPAVPTITTGSGRWLSRSTNLARLQPARRYSGENRPPTLISNSRATNISTSASRKFGVARPMKPTAMNR